MVEGAVVDGLAELPPGRELSAALDGLDLAAVPNGSVVEALRASWRQASHAYAVFWQAMVEVGRSVPVDDGPGSRDAAMRLLGEWAWSSAEIAAALTFTSRRADAEYAVAQMVVNRLPLVWAALRAGRIDHHKARVFADHLVDLTDAQITRICERLVPRAGGWTTGQLAARLWREVHAVDRDHVRRRYQRAVRDRGVCGYLDPDGTATITAHGLSPTEAAAAAERLEDLAAAIRRAGHPGTEHQLRADLFVGLLDGRFAGFTRAEIIAAMLADAERSSSAAPDDDGSTPARRAGPGSGPPTSPGSMPPEPDAGPEPEAGPEPGPETGPEPGPEDGHEDGHEEVASGDGVTRRPPAPGTRCGVEVRIGLGTLLGWDDHPAELAGWGPVLAEDARLLVARQAGAEWRVAVTDHDGYLLWGGLTRRRPSIATAACRGGVVEIHVPAAALDRIEGPGGLEGVARRGDLPLGWAPLVADLAAQHARWRLRDGNGSPGADRGPGREPCPGSGDGSGMDGHPDDRSARAALRRHVQMRDRTCVAPGCRRPARKAEQDHTRDHQHGGATVAGNLEPLCLRHHRMKHEGGWRLEQPEPGRFRWRSPLGEVYRTRGDPIAPDLPDPVPRSDPADGPGPIHDDRDEPTTKIDGPILRRRGPAEAPDPPPPAEAPRDPAVEVDDLPPF